MTLGEHDMVLVYEPPDDAVAARFMLVLNGLGAVRTRTMKAFPESAYPRDRGLARIDLRAEP
jgi:uncharacterized protein with GYD domain